MLSSGLVIIVMGVAGSGKSTIGPLLADALHGSFLDADSLHPLANIEKMARGVPLTDADRVAWLAAVRTRVERAFHRGQTVVIACSALKQSYRDYLATSTPITWVYLRGSEETIRRRLENRPGHYMKANMLTSQMETLEEPRNAIVADVTPPPQVVVEQVLTQLRKRLPGA